MPSPRPPLPRRRLLAAALAALAASALSWPPARVAAQPPDAPTIVVVTRHAEKVVEPGPDPALDSAGTRRARALADALRDADVAAAIVTQYRRTRLTAAPLVAARGIPVVERPVAAGQTDAYAAALAQLIRTSYRGRTVLVVGHSNTVPAIVAALGGAPVAAIPDERYGDVFVVTLAGTGARVVRLRVE